MGATRRVRAAFAVGLLCAAGLLGCQTARVAPRGEAGAGDAARLAVVRGEQGRGRLVVTARRWVAPPQRLLLHHSALWVELVNESGAALRFRPEDFVLELADASIPADPPLHLVRTGVPGSQEEARMLRSEGLRPHTLAPGETARGFLFFRHRFSIEQAREPVSLRLTLFDDTHETPLDRLEVPLEVTR